MVSDFISIEDKYAFVSGTLQTSTVGTEFIFGFITNGYGLSTADIYILVSNDNSVSAQTNITSLDPSIVNISNVVIPAQSSVKASYGLFFIH